MYWAAPHFHPAVRAGTRWITSGWQLGRDELDQRALRRAAWLVGHFRRRGLYEPESDCATSPLHVNGFTALPVLTRNGLQELFSQMEELYAGDSHYLQDTTSGSTGQPTRFFHHRPDRWLLAGMRHTMLQVVGWQPGLPKICLWGVVGKPQQAVSRRTLARLRLYADVVSMSPGPQQFEQLLELIQANAPCALYGFASAFETCAQWMLGQRRVLPPGQVVCAWNGAEMLTERTRELFAAAFSLPLRDLYGGCEVSAVAAECAKGRRHVNPRYIVEVVTAASQTPLPQGSSGAILVTDLFNTATPFIRYEIGDMGALTWESCPCGRNSYVLTRLEGRTSEQIILASGRVVNSMVFNPLMLQLPAVRSYLTVRLGPSSFEVRYVGDELSAEQQAYLIAAVSHELEVASVSIRRELQLPRAVSGKLLRYLDLSIAGPENYRHCNTVQTGSGTTAC
jgi:phenylacetate-CoA ligase